MTQTAKVFQNGRSQAVRLPAEFRFETKEVYVRRDPRSGDIILSARPDHWDAVFDAAKRVGSEGLDFLKDRAREQAQSRELF